MAPGVSRSAATILAGLLSGISRKAIVEFSFLLAVPTMLAATGYDLLKTAGHFSFQQFNFLAIGLLSSFLTAVLSIKFLLKFIQKNTFIPFGIYRIALALFFLFLVKP
jgi:undecaprenyl-diphosphatase